MRDISSVAATGLPPGKSEAGFGDTPPFAAAIAAAVDRAESEDIDEPTLPSLCALDVETDRCVAMVGR
jgi:hypothetical protein